MRKRAATLTFHVCLLWHAALTAAVPAPQAYLGFAPGADYKLANYEEITGYFQKLAASSDRIKLEQFGVTSFGRPMYVAYISDPANLRELPRIKEMNRKLALGLATADEARRYAKESKAIVWIDSGLHATEVAPAQHAPELAWRMVTAEDAETRRIRQNVVLMQIPCINPDGLDMVVDWYRQNVGTPYELAPLPFLYQKYAGHDNNRDWFMMNLPETRAAARLLFREWFPQIIYNQHQAPPFPARIFVPPYAEPLNPNIPAAVMEGINLIGSAMKERFARENKPGVLSYWGFDAWWNGGLRSAPAFHNMHGILTETALNAYATPREYKLSDLPERFANGMPTRQPGVFYQRPWMGGRWSVRDAIDYMLTADFAILDLAASRAPEFLVKAWEMAQSNITAGKDGEPYAYVVAADQQNAPEMVERLQLGGLDVETASEPFTVNGRKYPSGTFVVRTAQPFRPYLIDLMEPQRYPEIRNGANGPVKRPYDIAGWTLWMSMGVEIERVTAPLDAKLRPAVVTPLNNLIGPPQRRVAVYESWMPSSETGWTEWVLDREGVKYTALRNADIQAGALASSFDTIVLASQGTDAILHGWRNGVRPQPSSESRGDTAPLQRPEYCGGIGIGGAAELERFVREGGTLVALDQAADLPVRLFGLPVRPLVAGDNYVNPGSLVRLTTEKPGEVIYAFQSGGQAWDVALDPEFNKGERETKVLARYAAKNLLASGWLTGERTVAGKAAVVSVRHGKGKVYLFGFRPQFRGQTFGTFPMLLKAIAGE